MAIALFHLPEDLHAPIKGQSALNHGQAEKVEAYLPAINPLQSNGKSC
jgi:hypothetical protein